jgi:protein-S-isoprenylcysteine O-methyltransferase Ste14
VFALATTAYILIAIQLEEHDLIESLGQAYRDYKKEVPALIPFTRRQVARADARTA